jgi:hypothetical protein
LACARRNWRHETPDRCGAGSTPARCRMLHTVLAPIVSPSRHSSPWTAVAPGRVLFGQPQDQLAELGRHGGTATPVG